MEREELEKRELEDRLCDGRFAAYLLAVTAIEPCPGAPEHHPRHNEISKWWSRLDAVAQDFHERLYGCPMQKTPKSPAKDP